jgi:hypothetical protein
MSLMDKLKSLLGGGSTDAADPHAGHDHSVPHTTPEPAAPPVDPAGMSTSEPQPSVSQPASEEDDRVG